MTWNPTLGALPEPGGVRFRLWAPAARTVELVLEGPGPVAAAALRPGPGGRFSAFVPGVRTGQRYRYRLDGRGPFPDPASRFQPEGVHGPSQVVDPRAFTWSDQGWRGVAPDALVLYELHVGTFTPEGTFRAVIARLPHLEALGVTAVELMPLADFPGERNWGYDGAALFAPARCYGTPDDLRALVDAAHRHGLALHLDVVYNHLGPDGAYLAAFAPCFLTRRHRNPWGMGVDLDGEGSPGVRAFLIENALHWVHEYRLDGLRLDATPMLVDESPRHFAGELAARVKESVADRPVAIVAEDVRNLPAVVSPERAGGWGLDGVWSFDLHHQVHRVVTGEREGYYCDFEDSMEDLATVLRDGWLFRGRPSRYYRCVRGSDPAGLEPRRFVTYLQDHDEIGNRPHGERLHHLLDLAAWRALSVLHLLAPQTPLLFMGQEWAAGTPFHFFTDHHEKLATRIDEARRRGYEEFAAHDPEAFPASGEPRGARHRATAPHAQDPATFEASRLDWGEPAREPHASVLRLHRALLALRRADPSLAPVPGASHDAAALGPDALWLRRAAPGAHNIVVAARLRGVGPLALDLAPEPGLADLVHRPWRVLLSSEDAAFAPDPAPIRMLPARDTPPPLEFARPGAVVFAVE